MAEPSFRFLISARLARGRTCPPRSIAQRCGIRESQDSLHPSHCFQRFHKCCRGTPDLVQVAAIPVCNRFSELLYHTGWIQAYSQNLSPTTMLRTPDKLLLAAAFLSFLFSVYLWFSGHRDTGIFVGIWVPSILAFGVFFRLAIQEARNV